MFNLIVSPKSQIDLKKISKLHKKALALALEEIKENPHLGKSLKRELTGRFSYRVGVYRIIYKINWKDKVIYIITAGHRAVVYK